LADEDVPGTAAYRRQQKFSNEMLAMFSVDATSKGAVKTQRTKR
jgi:hypothetical protein